MGIISSFKSLICADSNSSGHPITLKDAVGIIQAYAKCLENRALSTSIVTDSKELPCSKEEIKAALLVAMNANIDPVQKKHLAIGYVQLADFQSGVGDKLVGLDISNIDIDADGVELLAEQVSQSQQDFDNWNLLVDEEQKLLLAELKKAGFETPL